MSVLIKPNKPVIRDQTDGLKLFIYGKPNIGKTTLATSFPNAIILNTDGNLGRFDVPSYSIKAWKFSPRVSKYGIKEDECFVDVAQALLQGDHDFDTIVIEIGSHIYNYCRNYILDKKDIEHEGDLDYGKGHTLVSTEYQKIILMLFNSKYNILFITHEKQKQNRGKNGSTNVDYTVPDLSDNVNKMMSGLTVMTAHFTILEDFDKGKKILTRVLRINPESEFDLASNKIGLTDDYIELEEGYEYEDIVALIKANKTTKVNIKESRGKK